MTARLSAFMRTNPTRGQMLDFLEELNKLAKQRAYDEEIKRICEAGVILVPVEKIAQRKA